MNNVNRKNVDCYNLIGWIIKMPQKVIKGSLNLRDKKEGDG
jgi:hypothetical protein